MTYVLPKTITNATTLRRLCERAFVNFDDVALKAKQLAAQPKWDDYMEALCKIGGYEPCPICKAPKISKMYPGARRSENVCGLFPVHRLPTFKPNGPRCIKHSLVLSECDECCDEMAKLNISRYGDNPYAPTQAEYDAIAK